MIEMVDTVDTAYEIAVCGGGFAGISAALAAARMGKKVILIEKQFMLGGLATAALSSDFLRLDVKILQAELQKNGVVLHEKDL